MKTVAFAAALAALSVLAQAQTGPKEGEVVVYDAALHCPGGEICFGLRLERGEGRGTRAFVTNGEESIPVPMVVDKGDEIALRFDYYDSEITAAVYPAGVMTGEWRKRRSKDEWTTLPFSATPGGLRTADIRPMPGEFVGRWRVRFAEDTDPAVAVFSGHDRRDLRGTFLTTTGDYRFLAGSASDHELTLSCFDGSHAFLFKAALQPDGSLKGDFWSGPAGHDTWTAERDDSASLPDPFGLTTFTGTSAAIDALAFPDGKGEMRSLSEFAGRSRIIEVFGTWCPNCLDATVVLSELHRRYADRGLAIIGLAFELTGDAERDRRQVRLYAERHGVPYTILVAGKRDKEEIQRKFPVIDKLRGYPTFVFIDASGAVRGVYTGFSGPATGEAHERLKRAFADRVEVMLGGEGHKDAK